MSTIPSILPREIKAGILKDVILHKGTFTCRLVCKEWMNIIDQDVLKIFVTELQRRLKDIPQPLHTIVITFTDQANPKNTTTLQCDIKTFQAFDKHLKTVICPVKPGLIASPEKIEELDTKGTNLHILWDAIKTQVNPPPSSPLQTWSEISTWMKNNPHALASITYLNLSAKGLTAFPPEIGLLTRLLKLILSNNQITSLPPELENLTQLQELSLVNNPITNHSGIEKLTQLRWLDLENNQISSLFRIENLTQLQWLDLRNNQITNLLGIENLNQLQKIYLDDNPLLFMHDNILSSNNEVFRSNNRIQQFKDECCYPATSAFAKLYQAIITRENENEISEKIKTAFKDKELKEDDRNLIYKMIYVCSGSPQTSDLRWGEHHVFDHPDTFFRAVRKAGLAKFHELTLDAKNKAYGFVYILASKPTTLDLQWGEHHALKNLPRLFDALEMHEQGK